MDPVIHWVARVALALIFFLSGMAKLLNRSAFLNALRNYRLLPARLEAPVALIVPLAELAGAVLVVVAPGRGGLVLLGLLGVFTLAILLGLRQGGGFDCGCLGLSGLEEPLSPWLLVRNSLLGLLAVSSLLPVAVRPLGVADVCVIGLGGLFLVLAYLALIVLLANVVRLSELRRYS